MGPLAVPELHTLDGVQVQGVPPELALYPFGVFTTFVLVDGSVLGWSDHVARLTRDARLLWDYHLDPQKLASEVGLHVRLLNAPASVRVTLYPEALQLARPSDARGCRILASSRLTEFPYAPQPGYTVRTCEYQRELPAIKSTDVFSQLRHRREAQLAGFDDALYLRRDQVLEGSTWTVLSWRDGEVATPIGPVLESITAVHLAAVAEELGWGFKSRPITRAELSEADLVLAANAISPARAIRSIDARSIAVDYALLSQIAHAMSLRERQDIGDLSSPAGGATDPTAVN